MSVYGLPSDAQPTIQQLCVLNTKSGSVIDIRTRIAAGWKSFGLLLNFDATGTELDLIESMHHHKPIPCYEEMMKKWLSGKGEQPVSWKQLLKLLKDNGMKTLAEEIKDAICT